MSLKMAVFGFSKRCSFSLYRNLRNQIHPKHIFCVRSYSASFYDAENKHAYSIVCKHSVQSKLTSFPSSSIPSVYKELLDPLVSEKAQSTIIEPISCLSNLSDVDYLELVSFVVRQKLAEIENQTNLDLKSLIRALDAECCRRLPQWTLNQALQAAEMFYQVKYSRSSSFNAALIGHFAHEIHKFTSAELLRYLFYLNLSRNFHASLNAEELERALLRHLNAYDIEDLSVVAMAFFKCQKPIRNLKIVQHMIRKLVVHSASVSDVSLAALLKAIRLSGRLDTELISSIRRLQCVFYDQVPRLNFMNCLHLVLVGSGTNLFHHSLLENVSQKFLANSAAVRLKELERLAFSLSFTQWDLPSSEQFWNVLEKELMSPERQTEIEAYPGSLIAAVLYFIIRERFPEPLIQRVLDRSFIESSMGKLYRDMLRSLLIIEQSCKIERPDLKVPKLDPELAKNILKDHASFFAEVDKRPNATNNFLFDLRSTLCTVTQNRTEQRHVLPYFPIPDLLVAVDAAGQVQAFPSCDVDSATGPFHRICIVVGTRGMFLHNSPQPTGNFSLKIRLLRCLGYRVITVPWFDYQRLNSNSSKVSYLQGKLKSALRNTKRPPF